MARAEFGHVLPPSGVAPLIAGAVVPIGVGALLPAHGWLVAGAVGTFALGAAVLALGLRDTETGPRSAMAVVAGASLTILMELTRGVTLWPPHAAGDRAAPALQFEYQRLEWWYAAPLLLATAAILAVVARVGTPLFGALF